MSKLLANEIANYGDNAPIDIKEGLNIPTGKPLQAAGVSGTSGQVLSSTGTTIEWVTPFDGDYNSLSNLPSIPAAQVPADWNATSGAARILNKPVVPPQPSVTTAAAGTAALAYNSLNGEFTFTPPDLSGYLTSYTETDPVFAASDAAAVTAAKISNWDTAFGWGNHASAGYLTSYTETQTLDDVLTLGATTTRDITTTGKVYFSNNFADLTALNAVNAGTYHGMFAHVHGTGKGYFSHDNVTSIAVTVGVDTVAGQSTGVFYFNGVERPGSFIIRRGVTYTFDQSDSSNATYASVHHPLMISATLDGELNGGSHYTTGVTYKLDGVVKTMAEYVSGFVAATTRTVEWTPAASAPDTLYYWCHYHTGQGNSFSIGDGSWVELLDTNSSLADLAGVDLSTPPATGQVLKFDGSNWVAAADGSGGGGISLTDLSVTTAAAGTAALSYNNVSGVFTYTPPDLSGYLTSYTETDPVFSASAAAGITSGQITNWTAAYNWGNHALVGYLTSETSHADVVVDGDFTSNGLMKRTAAGSYAIVTDNSSNWDTAYGWGDHSTQGYLTTLALNGVSDVTITSPQTNDVLTYNGSAWVNSPASGGGASVTISDTPPAASPGDLWWESDTGRLKIRYQDTDSTQWVDVSPPLADATSIGGSGTVAMLASLIPDTNAAYDLGNAEYKIRDLYLSSASDIRLKTDVVDYTGGLAFVESLRVVDFTWKDDVDLKAGKRETGLIAQEVKEALDASNYNSWRLHTDGDTQGLDKEQLIPALISAIQELSARVKELENK